MTDATTLTALGFREARVRARRLDIEHPAPAGLGPFCRLDVDDLAPAAPGVYAWTVDGQVAYVGKAKDLRQITQGQPMGRAYNDYTYLPPSQASNPSDPRARVNGQLNAALVAGSSVAWWWRALETELDALAEEARLIGAWSPAWNRAQPVARPPR